MSSGSHDTSTNPTIFLRLKEAQPEPREVAWDEFSARYAPMITAFARRLGAKAQDVEDVVQDVMIGFFLRSPKFVYDPAKGRFRSYLKTCTDRALRHRIGREVKLQGVPLDQIDPGAMSIEQVWNDVWEQQLLRRALEDVRNATGESKAFLAFERYVVFGEEAQAVATRLGMHLNSVYRAKEQITRALREKVISLREEHG